MKKSTTDVMLHAVFTITFFTVIDRVLGFLFKIYLSREMGAVQMGVYQVALSIFFLLLTVTTSGVPLIVSKLTAKYELTGNKKASGGTVSAALVVGLAAAVLVCGGTVLLRHPIGKLMASPESMTVLLFMLPGVLFSGIYAAFRGNLWGKQRYAAMSIIEVIEQVARIALTVLLFMLGFNRLKVTGISLSVSCAVTTLCCVFCYFAGKEKIASPKGHIVPLLKSAIPITFVRASNNIVNSLIAIVVPMILVGMGHSSDRALYIFGSSIGMAMPLLYIPITVVGSLACVMIPTLSSAYSSGNTASTRRQIETALTFSAVVAALFVPAFWALGEPIGRFVYDNADAGRFLSHAAWLLIPISIENIASSMLNSLDLEKRGFCNYMIGSLVLFGILGAFCRNFSIDVLAFGLGASLTVSSALDIACIRKRTGIRLSFFVPLAVSSLLVLPAAFLTETVYSLLPLPALLRIGVSAAVGCVFMVLLSFVFGTIDLSVVKRSRKKKIKTENGGKSFAKTA